MRASVSVLGAAILTLLLGGCRTSSAGAPPRAEVTGERFVSYIRIEGVVLGGAIKLDGSQVSMFPGYVTVEVDDAGKAVRRYVLSLSTNILGGDLGQYVIEQGQEIPAKIFFERIGPVPTGTAKIERRLKN